MVEADGHTEELRFVSAAASACGYSHLRRNLPCQDASCAVDDPAGAWHIAVVSDGHGDPRCARSDKGSKIAVQIASEKLAEFARHIDEKDDTAFSPYDNLKIPSRQATTIRKLTDAIVASWWDAVESDFATTPLSEDEEDAIGEEMARLYRSGVQIDHLYGATLICALMVHDLLILIQQGDGACVVLHIDGMMASPIGEDARCFANVTTSLCDYDAADNIRQAVVDLAENPLYACILATDGVDNSFTGEDSLKSYFKGMLIDFASDGDRRRFEGSLESALAELTEVGSGDDVSIAIIADIPAVKHASVQFQEDINEQQAEVEKRELRDKLVSMGRKHELLQKEYGEAEEKIADLDQAILDYKRTDSVEHSEIVDMKWQLRELYNRQAWFEERIEKIRWWRDRAFSTSRARDLDSQLVRLERKKALIDAELKNVLAQKALHEATRSEISQILSETQALREETYEQGAKEYEAYHAQYTEIEEKLRELEGHIPE